jgi:hypothetical protein
VLEERFQLAAGGRQVLGEHLAIGELFDIGFGVPEIPPGALSHAPNPDFMTL